MCPPRARPSFFFRRGDFNPRPHGAFVRADLESRVLAQRYCSRRKYSLRYRGRNKRGLDREYIVESNVYFHNHVK